MLPFKLVYPSLEMDFGEHVFPLQKYRLVREDLLREGRAEAADFVAAVPATEADVRRVHAADYVDKMRNGGFSGDELLRLEIPWSPAITAGFWLVAGGAIQAGRLALRDGCAILLGGGFHHAFAGHGEGFCLVNDVAVGTAALLDTGEVERVAIVDLDVHQGNGNAALFAGDPRMFTFSMHQEANYPGHKVPSTLDVGLDDGTGDAEYLEALAPALERVLAFGPDLIWYLAGADPYEGDRLAGLGLTFAGLAERDRVVFRAARDAGVPVVASLAGGYAARVADVVAIHVNMVLAAARVFARSATGDVTPEPGSQAPGIS